jgi:glutaredoxin 3
MRLALLLAALASGMALRMPQGMPQRMPQLAPRAVVLMASQIEADIQQTTADNAVVVYSKSWCPYCAQTKALFDSMDQPYTAIELDNIEDGDKLQAALLEMTQQRTVPNVFIGGQHLGGNDDTQQAARSGKLAEMLKASTGVDVPTGAPTAAQLEAVASGKMITETEATIRKVAGVGMGLATAFLYSTSGLAYTTLSAGAFGALSVYRSGASYQ